MRSKSPLKTDDIHLFCCQNPDCSDYGKRGLGNLTISGTSGGQGNRMLRCRSCGYRFSETRGTVLFNSKIDHDQAISVMEHLSEGCGLRKTSRLTEVSLGTVARLSKKSGKHAQLAHDELVGFPPQTNEVQFDEKWSFVGKKEKNCDPYDQRDDNYGDNWDHIAYDPEHRLILSVIPGKRTAENTHKLIDDFIRRTGGKVMRLITTDKYLPYKDAILVGYGRMVVFADSKVTHLYK